MKCKPGYTEIKDVLLKLLECKIWTRVSFSPLLRALRALIQVSENPMGLESRTDLVESSHRLISTANLQLVPVGLVVPALLIGTLHCSR
jgi:hypothetical protein